MRILYMHIATGQGQRTHCGQSFNINRTALSLWSFVSSFKQISSTWFTHFVHGFIHIYNPGIRADNLLRTNFWCQQKGLITLIICYKFQNISSNSDHTFFMILYMYIAPRQGQTTPWGQNFDVDRKALSLCPFVANFKNNSLNSDFIHIFHAFIHVYNPGARAENPLGTKFRYQHKPFIILVICY